MNSSRLLALLPIALLLSLTACSSPPPPIIYETVSAGALQLGSPIPLPTGELVLRVAGKISQTNAIDPDAPDAGDIIEFDMATLESIGLVQYEVDNPFTQERVVYTGVLITELLKVAGAAPEARTLRLTGLDEYSADMRIADVKKWPVLIATRADGAYMPPNKNGPLINVIPFNDFPEIEHLTYDALWVWALIKITVN